MDSTVLLIGGAFLLAIVLIAWGFDAVSKADMPGSERTLWKLFFVLMPLIAFVMFMLLRKKSVR